MPEVSRVGDIGTGVCYNHKNPTPYTTTIISGSSTVYVNGEQVCIVGSIGVASCGHNTVQMTGAPSSQATGEPIGRVGDTGQNSGTYTLISGSPNVEA